MNISNELNSSFTSFWEHLAERAPRIVVGIVVIVLLAIVLRFVRQKLIGLMSRKADDNLLVNFIDSVGRITNIIILILLFLYVLGLGNVAGTIIGAAGISAFVIGFALKDIGENFLAGVIMAFDRPFRLGDTIKTGNIEGVIVEMNLRDTHVKTFDGKDVYVPNGQIIKNPLYNYTIDGFLRLDFAIGVDYDTNVEQARSIIMETLASIPGILGKAKPPRTHVKNLSASTIDIECHFWIDTLDKYSGLELKSLAQSRSVAALQKNNISIPYDIIEIKKQLTPDNEREIPLP